MTTARKFRVVRTEPEPQQPEDALAELVPQLIASEREASRLRLAINLERRHLASKRGVAFIREEHVRREFGC